MKALISLSSYITQARVWENRLQPLMKCLGLTSCIILVEIFVGGRFPIVIPTGVKRSERSGGTCCSPSGPPETKL